MRTAQDMARAYRMSISVEVVEEVWCHLPATSELADCYAQVWEDLKMRIQETLLNDSKSIAVRSNHLTEC